MHGEVSNDKISTAPAADPAIPLIAVVGPTASGKTRVAADIALEFNGEIVSADSMQIYKGMEIGTAQPTREEKKGIPHYLVGIVEPGRDFSAALFVEAARSAIYDIHKRGKLPVIAGGTGLYISSLVDNIHFPKIKGDEKLRGELSRIAEEKGNERLLEMLGEFDPELAKTLHKNNRNRIIRAIEVYRATGVTFSQHMKNSRLMPSPYKLFMIGLDFRRRELIYDKINTRVDDMMDKGLVEEARKLFEKGFSKSSAQAIGYKELSGYLDGKITLSEAVQNIKASTRRYAKRQLTWFRRDNRVNWFYADDYRDYLEMILEIKKVLVKSSII